MMSLLFAASGLFFRTIISNNCQKLVPIKLLEIIVREKCGLPHHINYFCSPTYNVRHLCFVMQRYEENPTSATQSPKTYTNTPKIDIDDVGLPTSTTSTHRRRRCRFRGYGRGTTMVLKERKRWKGNWKGLVTEKTWKHKAIGKE